MNYLIFGTGLFLGTCLGLLLAFFLGAAARQERQMVDESEEWDSITTAMAPYGTSHDTSSPKN